MELISWTFLLLYSA